MKKFLQFLVCWLITAVIFLIGYTGMFVFAFEELNYGNVWIKLTAFIIGLFLIVNPVFDFWIDWIKRLFELKTEKPSVEQLKDVWDVMKKEENNKEYIDELFTQLTLLGTEMNKLTREYIMEKAHKLESQIKDTFIEY